MLSIEKCRELLDEGEKYSDREIEEIRASLYEMAGLSLEDYFDRIKKKP